MICEATLSMFCLRPWITEVDIEAIYFTWRNNLFNTSDIKEDTLALSRSASKIFVLRNKLPQFALQILRS